MKIVRTFGESLFAVKYPGESHDEIFRPLHHERYIEMFLEKNKAKYNWLRIRDYK